MTDLETIKAMLERKDIQYSVINDDYNGSIIIAAERGYFGFVVEFTFTKDGEFQDIGAYE